MQILRTASAWLLRLCGTPSQLPAIAGAAQGIGHHHAHIEGLFPSNWDRGDCRKYERLSAEAIADWGVMFPSLESSLAFAPPAQEPRRLKSEIALSEADDT